MALLSNVMDVVMTIGSADQAALRSGRQAILFTHTYTFALNPRHLYTHIHAHLSSPYWSSGYVHHIQSLSMRCVNEPYAHKHRMVPWPLWISVLNIENYSNGQTRDLLWIWMILENDSVEWSWQVDRCRFYTQEIIFSCLKIPLKDFVLWFWIFNGWTVNIDGLSVIIAHDQINTEQFKIYPYTFLLKYLFLN